MKIPLSVSEAAGLRMPVKMAWEAYNVLTPSAYLMTETDDGTMLEALRKIRDSIDHNGGTVGSVKINPVPAMTTTLHYEVSIVSNEDSPLDEEVVMFVTFGDTNID